MDVPSLDNRVLRVPLKEVVRPGYERLVANEGGRESNACSCVMLCCTKHRGLVVVGCYERLVVCEGAHLGLHALWQCCAVSRVGKVHGL